MISLAVKYRPKNFSELTEQKSIVKILEQELATNHVKNCYLFSGKSGSGKTTAARALASAINNNIGEPIEIDAASNSSVENVRNIIRSAQERSIDSKYKVYIIDECHALSNQAWQAFLKCIEEPPEFTIFIFCTTDPQKVPATILNRVEKFNFTRISNSGIESRLRYICTQEGFTNFDLTINYISRISDGGMRDAICMLEKCASYSTDLSLENCLQALGNYNYDIFFNLVNAFIDNNQQTMFQIIDKYYNEGADLKLFIDQLLNFILDITKYATFKKLDLLKIPSIYESELKRVIAFDNPANYFLYIVDKLLDLKNTLKTDQDPYSTITAVLLQICRCK